MEASATARRRRRKRYIGTTKKTADQKDVVHDQRAYRASPRAEGRAFNVQVSNPKRRERKRAGESRAQSD